MNSQVMNSSKCNLRILSMMQESNFTRKLLKVEQFSTGSLLTCQWQNCDWWNESEWQIGIIGLDYKGWHGYFYSRQYRKSQIKVKKSESFKVKIEDTYWKWKWMANWHLILLRLITKDDTATSTECRQYGES